VNRISGHDEAVHGVPGSRRLRARDPVKLDVTAGLHGSYADAWISSSSIVVIAAAPLVTD
jgi:methionine aminopeptidase